MCTNVYDTSDEQNEIQVYFYRKKKIVVLSLAQILQSC
jgi:hypothetical protein